MSRRYALWMSESKCQRSRSQCSDYLKWCLAHNCFPFPSAIIKLHAQIPCESRICLADILIKILGSLNWLPLGVFVPLGQPHSSWFKRCPHKYTAVVQLGQRYWREGWGWYWLLFLSMIPRFVREPLDSFEAVKRMYVHSLCILDSLHVDSTLQKKKEIISNERITEYRI